MRAARFAPFALWMLLCPTAPALAQVSLDFNSPGVDIGVNVGTYPVLERVPGYPVYYAPRVGSNYFFYDGLYWVYERDNWYASSWYNGPWRAVDRFDVPVYLLRVPVRYYHHAPSYFRGWGANEAPRWGEHWGGSWSERRHGWDQWDRQQKFAYAPLPSYQREYYGNRYPHATQQSLIEHRSYSYRPHDPVAVQHWEHRSREVQAAPAQERRQERPQAQAQPQPQSSVQPRQQFTSQPQAVQQQQPQVQPRSERQSRQAQPQQAVQQPQPQAVQSQPKQQQHEARSGRPQQPQAQAQPQPQAKEQPKPQVAKEQKKDNKDKDKDNKGRGQER